jgi:hypothetical protein
MAPRDICLGYQSERDSEIWFSGAIADPTQRAMQRFATRAQKPLLPRIPVLCQHRIVEIVLAQKCFRTASNRNVSGHQKAGAPKAMTSSWLS